VSATELRGHVVGTWWYDAYDPKGPFSLVTFSPNGQLSVLHTNTPSEQEHHAYWRIDQDGDLIITKTKGALPGSDNSPWNLEIFTLDRMTDTEMVFSHPSMAGRMTFKK
jgi:hypothetical protein